MERPEAQGYNRASYRIDREEKAMSDQKNSEYLLRPGRPDDDNRDYLPERIKGSDIVVNENGNNSQPYPERLTEFHEDILGDGRENVWYEYVPESYEPGRKTPLVVSLHGGMMTGWGQAIYTSWTIMAEKHGFIVVFPDASYNRFWQDPFGPWRYDGKESGEETESAPPGVTPSPENIRENRDVNFLLALIERMKEKYTIDAGRIYMQGMSMGNMMTAQFARHFGHLLAGAAGSGACTFLSLLYDEKGNVKNEGGPVAIWQSRPETNNIPENTEFQKYVNRYNKYYWMKINGCAPVPEISIAGENNFAFYRGEKADLVYLDIKNRDHGQSFDDAALIWNYLFSGVRRNEKGQIERIPGGRERRGDAFSLAFAEDCAYAWHNNKLEKLPAKALRWKKLKYHGLDGGVRVRGEYICAPLSFLAKVFGAGYETACGGRAAALSLPDGRRLQFAEGSIGCMIDDDLRSMYCEALFREGELLVPADWFCAYIFNLHVSACDGVLYVTDHFNSLSLYMADILKELLSNGGKFADYEAIGFAGSDKEKK